MSVIIRAISDTHNAHHKLEVGSGDIIIHAGDATFMGYKHELEDFCKWYGKQNFTHKIYVPGNHDIGLERNYEEYSKMFKDNGIMLLNDESVVLEGIDITDYEDYKLRVYGSPITPRFGNWAYMKTRGEPINKHWMKIPYKLDILITHGPPYCILDSVPRGLDSEERVGCEMLHEAVMREEPKIHIFGHIHESRGHKVLNRTNFFNASCLDERYSKVSNGFSFMFDGRDAHGINEG